MKLILINTLYYIILGFKYFYIYTHNFFTWIYNLIAKEFGWNVRFYYAHEELPEDATINKIKNWFRFKNKNKENNTVDYKQKYLDAKAQSDRNFGRYKHRKAEAEKHLKQYEQEKQKVDNLTAQNKALQAEINRLKNQQSSTKTNTNNSQKPDNRTATEILGLSTGFTSQQLDDAHKRLVSRYHPDKHVHMSDEFQLETTEEFKKIQVAYNKIK